MARALSEKVISGLIYLHKYRFLTIAHFAKITGFSLYHSAEVLRDFERWGMVGFIGNVFIPGAGRPPKVYYLKKKGFEFLCREAEIEASFSEVVKEASWTPAMYHRLKTIDLMLSAEVSINKRPHLQLPYVFLENRMIKRGNLTTRETTDYVSAEESSENKLIPDAVFIIENIETEKKALFFLKTDLGHEPIVARVPRQHRNSITFKLSQYDRYLTGMRFQQTYKAYGDFGFFMLLFVTTTPVRVENIRQETGSLAPTLAKYYKLSTFAMAEGTDSDFCGAIWKSRNPEDHTRYALVRE